MKAVFVNAGRCQITVGGKQCGKPAYIKQVFPGGRQFLFCKEHKNDTLERLAEEEKERAEKAKK